MQADGKILLAGDFDSVGGTPRGRIARLNNDAATQSVTAESANVFWLRSGAALELGQVASSSARMAALPGRCLGSGMRVAGGWQLAGAQPTSGSVRARGRTGSGYGNGSLGLIEQVQSLHRSIVVDNPLASASAAARPSISATSLSTATRAAPSRCETWRAAFL